MMKAIGLPGKEIRGLYFLKFLALSGLGGCVRLGFGISAERTHIRADAGAVRRG